MRPFFSLCAVLLFSAASAFGYTNILEGGTGLLITNGWDAAGDMIVGDVTSSNTLQVAAGGSLTNADAYVGRQAGASNNTASVAGSGAEWITAGTLQVGAAGNSNNSVTVSGGGALSAGNLVIADGSFFNLNRDGMLALDGDFDVSTAGFSWNTGGTLAAGGDVTGLSVTNGTSVLVGEKKLVLNGGRLIAETNLVIGFESSGNELVITNGGTVSSADGYIGWGADASDNTVLVSGTGSAWTNSGHLHVGVWGTNLQAAGSGNMLTVTNEAWVFVGGYDAGLAALGSGGITVAGGSEMTAGAGSSVLTDGLYIDAAGTFDLYGGLTVKGDFDAGQAGFNWQDGSTLSVNGALTYSEDLSGTNRTLNLDGGSWDRSGDLALAGEGNLLAVLNGGGLTSDAAFISGNSNTVSVAGAGSSWLNSGSLNITDSNNAAAVASGGTIIADALSIAAGNAVYLNDGGSLRMTGGFDLSVQTNLEWNAGGNLSVGGLLEGMPVATNLSTADTAYLDGARVLTLDGGTWAVGESNLIAGLNSDLNRLVITNGGSVDNADGYIGWGSSGDLNEVTVSAGGTWTNLGGGLYVGRWLNADTNWVDAGQDNRLTVESGGWVFVGEAVTNGPGGMVVASTNGAELVIGGNGSAVTVEQGLYVGLNAAASGTVSIAEGGSLKVGELFLSADSVLDLSGALAVESGFDAGQSGFTWNDGGSLSVGGALSGLYALAGTNRTLAIDGGSWDTTASNLYVIGSGNTLYVTNGAQVTSASAYIGVSSNDVDNTVLVGDTGSEWNLSGDLAVNAGNTLEMATNGLVTVAGSMSVSNAAVDGTGTVRFSDDANTFSISGEQSRISTNILFEAGGGDDLLNISDFELAVSGSFADRFVGFETLAMTNSRLSGSGTVDVFDTLSLSGSALAPSGELLIDGALSVSDSRLQLTAGYGILSVTNSGALDLTGLAADISVSNNAAPAGFNELVLRSADGFTAGGFATTNFNEHYLLYDFRLTNDTTAVTAVSTAARDGEISSTLAYSGIQGVRAGFDGMQNTLFTRTRQLRRNAVATDYAISNEAYLLSDTNAPSGPPGPGDRNTIFGMHFWAEQFSGQGDYDRMGISDGYVLNNNGTTFGFDRLLGDSFALGLNYTYARSAARSDGGDQMDTETYWLALYGEWFSTEGYYLDGLLGYGWSDYNSLRVEEGYRGIGTTEGTGLGGHLEAGKYFHRGNWALAPYAGLHYLGIESDDYTEAERDSGLEVEVEGQNAASLESALGVKARSRFDTAAGRFQAVGYTEWAYDFVNDDIETTLSGDGVTVSTARITPDEQTLNAGLGLSWICTEYLEVGVGYDGRFGKSYEEHTGSAMLEVRF